MRSTAAEITVSFGYRSGKLHICGVWISSLQRCFISPAALRLVSTAELVIAHAINHFNGNTPSRVKREEVLIQRLYRLLLLDPTVDSCGNHFFDAVAANFTSVEFESVVYRLRYSSASLLFDGGRQLNW